MTRRRRRSGRSRRGARRRTRRSPPRRARLADQRRVRRDESVVGDPRLASVEARRVASSLADPLEGALAPRHIHCSVIRPGPNSPSRSTSPTRTTGTLRRRRRRRRLQPALQAAPRPHGSSSRLSREGASRPAARPCARSPSRNALPQLFVPLRPTIPASRGARARARASGPNQQSVSGSSAASSPRAPRLPPRRAELAKSASA